MMCFEIRAQAQDYIILPQGNTIANISDKGVNRIAISNDRITQVIGNEDEYIIESDANLGQVFLTPILKEPQEISLRLVTEREKIIDVKFKIKKIEPQTILLKYKNDSNTTIPALGSDNLSPVNSSSSMNQMSSNTETQQIIDNIKLVYSNKLVGIKLTTLGCLKTTDKLKSVKLMEATQYSVNKQIIVRAIISNSKKSEILLSEKDFSNCMAIVKAVSLDSNKVMHGVNTTIYMVGQDGK
jgi:hypothetical protein